MNKEFSPENLRIKTLKELENLLKQQRNNLYKLQLEKDLKKLKQTHLIKETKKIIARILTIMNEKRNEKKS
ncbi:MAG: 50S ribosomal protein L29 [Minisyncoccia bacterium]